MNLIFIKTKNKNFKKKGYTGEDKQKEYVAHGFCTNIPIKTKGAARAIVEQYKARWGIESFYKDSKFFYLKTTSNNSIIRDFFFAMSVITFNLWILCNLICFIAYLRRPPEKPRIRMRTFAQSLKGIEYKDPPPDED